ncbi:metallopeptidase family protein [Cellulomonas soli]
MPLGRYFPADAGLPARIVLYRRPVESRATDPGDLAELVRDVVVEQVAHMLGRSPEDIDPDYSDGRDGR